MNVALAATAGFFIGIVVTLVVRRVVDRREVSVAERLVSSLQQQHTRDLATTVDQLRQAFAGLSREALTANTDDFLKLANSRLEQQARRASETLDHKKKLIDTRIDDVTNKLTRLNDLIHEVDKKSRESHGLLRGHVDKAMQATNRLQETTSTLREALANPKRRGQWGERMAEDILKMIGLRENINYSKQKRIGNRRIPDFTFPLPNDRVVHMDVKFPLTNYLKVLDAGDDSQRQAATQMFLKDVRLQIKAVTARDYINPGEGTIDYVLVFIPNEQVYGFIHEQDPDILDEAMRSKVVLCSPISLYAILAVIRQASENFRLEEASRKILAVLDDFRKQWTQYCDTMDRLGERIESALDQYNNLVGVRRRQLDRQLRKVEDLSESDIEPRTDIDAEKSASRADIIPGPTASPDAGIDDSITST